MGGRQEGRKVVVPAGAVTCQSSGYCAEPNVTGGGLGRMPQSTGARVPHPPPASARERVGRPPGPWDMPPTPRIRRSLAPRLGERSPHTAGPARRPRARRWPRLGRPVYHCGELAGSEFRRNRDMDPSSRRIPTGRLGSEPASRGIESSPSSGRHLLLCQPVRLPAHLHGAPRTSAGLRTAPVRRSERAATS